MVFDRANQTWVREGGQEEEEEDLMAAFDDTDDDDDDEDGEDDEGDGGGGGGGLSLGRLGEAGDDGDDLDWGDDDDNDDDDDDDGDDGAGGREGGDGNGGDDGGTPAAAAAAAAAPQVNKWAEPDGDNDDDDDDEDWDAELVDEAVTGAVAGTATGDGTRIGAEAGSLGGALGGKNAGLGGVLAVAAGGTQPDPWADDDNDDDDDLDWGEEGEEGDGDGDGGWDSGCGSGRGDKNATIDASSCTSGKSNKAKSGEVDAAAAAAAAATVVDDDDDDDDEDWDTELGISDSPLQIPTMLLPSVRADITGAGAGARATTAAAVGGARGGGPRLIRPEDMEDMAGIQDSTAAGGGDKTNTTAKARMVSPGAKRTSTPATPTPGTSAGIGGSSASGKRRGPPIKATRLALSKTPSPGLVSSKSATKLARAAKSATQGSGGEGPRRGVASRVSRSGGSRSGGSRSGGGRRPVRSVTSGSASASGREASLMKDYRQEGSPGGARSPFVKVRLHFACGEHMGVGVGVIVGFCMDVVSMRPEWRLRVVSVGGMGGR
jgi:hypothetical protein